MSTEEGITRAIVIDNGTRNIKAGFSEDGEPTNIFNTITTSLTKEQTAMTYTGFIRESKLSQPQIANDILSIIDKYTPSFRWIGEARIHNGIRSRDRTKGGRGRH